MVTEDLKDRPDLKDETERKEAEAFVPKNRTGRVNTEDPDKIAKIREILFGVQMRKYEERFSTLEQQMRSEIAELRTLLDRRSESLKKQVGEALGELKERMAQEERRRDELFGELRQELDTRDEALNRQVAELDARLTKSTATLQKQLIAHSENLAETLRRNNEQAEAALRQLEAEKAGRLALSELFTEMAMGLTRDPSPKPETESEKLKNE